MKTLTSYNHTIYASYLGYISQAIVNNFAPLLFLTFREEFGLSLGRLALIPTVCFLTQLVVDLLSAKYVDRIGYRPCILASQILSVLGLTGLAILPGMLPNPFLGILISVVLAE